MYNSLHLIDFYKALQQNSHWTIVSERSVKDNCATRAQKKKKTATIVFSYIHT